MKLTIITAIALTFLVSLFWHQRMNGTKIELSYAVESAPFSADPLEFDALVHHVTFGSTLSPLVSSYAKGKHTGLLAESWTVSPDQRIWVFKVRSRLTFEDGASITPKTIIDSLTRIACLLKERHSKTGLVEFLEGFDELSNSNRNIPGLLSDSSSVTFKFIKPMRDLLDQLSFGMYAVVSPRDFDQKTLKWHAGINPTASGPYRIVKHENKSTHLELRRDYPKDLLHKSVFEKIHLLWDMGESLKADMFFGSSTYKATSDYSFVPSGLRDIYFVKIISSQDPTSPLQDKEARRWLRDAFYNSYKRSGFKPPAWFFPAFEGPSVSQNEFSRPIFPGRKRIRFSKMEAGASKRLAALNRAFEEMASSAGLTLEPVRQDMELEARDASSGKKAQPAYDLFVMGTQIRIDSPDESIRFMFRSKEGIRLPDTDGRIEAELRKNRLDLTVINGLIEDQAAVWPTLHPEMGFYLRKNAGIDLTQLNLGVPPIQFQWIGQK